MPPKLAENSLLSLVYVFAVSSFFFLPDLLRMKPNARAY
jgi:hypothetical protein